MRSLLVQQAERNASMIQRIVLENFMSHARTEIEPARGLTVLIGPNNCGKSAVVSALQTLCSNITGDFMVRHGEKECRVTIETDDGHSVTWRRLRGAVSYLIDGREVPRGVTPDDLHQVLRLPKVVSEDGKDQFDIHFGTQKSPIFLLDESERRAAMFFASSSDAEYLMRMQKRHQEKVRLAKHDREGLVKTLTKLEGELTSLDPVAELSETLQTVVEEHTAIVQQEQRLTRWSQDCEQFSQQTELLSRQVAECDYLSELRSPPPMVALEQLMELIEQIAVTEARRVGERNCLEVLEDVPTPPIMAETQPLAEMCRMLPDATRGRDLERLRSIATEKLVEPPELADTTALDELHRTLADAIQIAMQAGVRGDSLSSLRSIPDLEEELPRQMLLRDWQSAEEAVATLRVRHETLQRLTEPPIARDLTLLATLLESCESTQGEIDRFTSQRVDADREQQSVLEAVRAWTVANPVCPTCGSEVDAEQLVTWGHAHG